MDRLPNELGAEVFCFLDVVTLIKCSQVNRRWNGISKIRYVCEFKFVYTGKKTTEEKLKSICHVHTLAVNINKHSCVVLDISSLASVHTLKIRLIENNIRGINTLRHVHTLHLGVFDGTSINFSALDHVHTLDLSCPQRVDIGDLSHLHTLYLNNTSLVRTTNINVLGNIHTLRHISMGTSDLNDLMYVHTLTASMYMGMIDVSVFRNVHTLELALYHTEVVNANYLGCIHTLNLYFGPYFSGYGPKLKLNYRALNRVHTLIASPQNADDIIALGEGYIHTLNLTRCSNIMDVSPLDRLHTLHHQTGKIKDGDVSALGHLHTLDLSYANITDVSALGQVHTLDLSSSGVVDVSALGRVHTLNISDTEVKAINALGRVHTLGLRHTKVEDISALERVHTLDLRGITIMTNINAIGGDVHIHTLHLSSKSNTVDISAFGHVNTLYLYMVHVEEIILPSGMTLIPIIEEL